MIQFKNVTKRYGNKTAVDDLTFEIKEGETFVLIGPSGCGKTTTLKMINRLIPLTNGYIYFKDRPISDYQVYEMRWDIGYVLQQIALFPHMTIRENIAQVPLMKKWSDSDIDGRIDELLEMVGMEPEQFKNRKPSELSGGQQQRALIARALAQDTRVLLLDEPTSALDLRYQIETLQLVRRITREEGISALIAIHDLNHAARYCDQVIVLHGGRLVADGTPQEALRAETLRGVYEVDVEVEAREGAVEVRPRVDEAGFTRTGTRLDELVAS